MEQTCVEGISFFTLPVVLAQLVETLLQKQGGHGFESQWCQWYFY